MDLCLSEDIIKIILKNLRYIDIKNFLKSNQKYIHYLKDERFWKSLLEKYLKKYINEFVVDISNKYNKNIVKIYDMLENIKNNEIYEENKHEYYRRLYAAFNEIEYIAKKDNMTIKQYFKKNYTKSIYMHYDENEIEVEIKMNLLKTFTSYLYCGLNRSLNNNHYLVTKLLLIYKNTNPNTRFCNEENLTYNNKIFILLFNHKHFNINKSIKLSYIYKDINILKLFIQDPRIDLNYDNGLIFKVVAREGNLEILKFILDNYSDKFTEEKYNEVVKNTINCDEGPAKTRTAKLLLTHANSRNRINVSFDDNYILHNLLEKLSDFINEDEYIFDETWNPNYNKLRLEGSEGELKETYYKKYFEILQLVIQHPTFTPPTKIKKYDSFSFSLNCKHGLKILKMLVKNGGFDPSISKNNLFIYCCKERLINILKYLLNNCDINPADQNNLALKSVFKSSCDVEIVKLLLEHPNSKDKIDITFNKNYLFRYAANVGKVKVLKLLLEHPNSKDKINPADKKNYALRYASFRGCTNVVKLLLKHPNSKNKINPLDKEGKALEYAKIFYDKTILYLLINFIESKNNTNNIEYLKKYKLNNIHSINPKLLNYDIENLSNDEDICFF